MTSVSITRVFATWALVLPAALLSPCASRAQGADTVAARAGFPPVENFIRKPKYRNVTLSPDGKLLAAVVPTNDRGNLAIIDLEKRTATAITSLTKDDVYQYSWVGDRTIRVITANLADAGGLVTVTQDVIIDTQGKVVRPLMPGTSDRVLAMPRGAMQIVAILDRAGDDLIVQDHTRTLESYDAYRFNPRTGARQLLTLQSPGEVTRFVADRDGQVRVAVSDTRDGKRTRLSYRRSNNDAWKTLLDEPVEARTLTPIAFDFDNKILYVYSRDKDAGGRNDVYAYDPETGKLGERIYQNTGLDAGTLIFDWVKKVPIGIRDGSRDAVRWIDPAWDNLQKSIDSALPRTRNVLSWGRYDNDDVVVATESETQPPVFYLLDRKSKKMEEVAVSYPWLKEDDLSPRRFVRYPARDGKMIPGYLTMPKRPDGAKPPLIVNIHGGPFVRTHGFGYNGDAQLFASRGYAVLEPDFRGTIGYGDAFEQAGWRQWGLAMQDDVTDGVKWLVETGKVDPDRVCLFGASYGGYATLWGLEKEPAMFRCGVAFVAVSDLEMLFDVNWSDVMRYEQSGNSTNFLTRVLGDPDRDREKLRAVSPLLHADRIQAPLLLAYGAADERVPLVHGNRMRSALDKYRKSYEWVVYDDEGHGFNKESNNTDFYRRVDAFLARNLAPRASTAAAGNAPSQ